jgi:hypothetical protein
MHPRICRRQNQRNGQTGEFRPVYFRTDFVYPFAASFSAMECSTLNSAVSYRFLWWSTNCNERCARMNLAEHLFQLSPSWWDFPGGSFYTEVVIACVG